MPNKRRFSNEEEGLIIREYQRKKVSFTELAKKWGCSPATIREVLNRNNVEIKPYYLTTKQKLSIIEDYVVRKMPMSVVAEEYKISAPTVCLILRKHNVPARDAHLSNMKYELDEKVLDGEIDEHKAYWLGFFMGDGSIVKSRLTVELAKEDCNHLVKLRAFLKSTHPIKCYAPSKRAQGGSSKLVWHSSHMIETMKTFGIVPNKSSINVTIPLKLSQVRDFWRGMVDSDGGVKIIKTKAGYEMPSLYLVGTQTLMELFLKFVLIHTPTKASVRPADGKMLYRIKLDGKPARKMIHVLYNASIVSLERKLEIAKLIMKHYPPIDEEAEKRTFLQLRSEGIGRIKAIRAIGRSYTTLDNWLVSDPDFSLKEWNFVQHFNGKKRSITKHPLSNKNELDEKIHNYFSFRNQGLGRSRSAKMAGFSYKTVIKMIKTNPEFAKNEEKYSTSK